MRGISGAQSVGHPVSSAVVERPSFEVADVLQRFGSRFVAQCAPNVFTLRTLDALAKCRTAALGGHTEVCSDCGSVRISYNSCGNRHCPKCQATRQALWAEDRSREALDVKHFHVVFTIPEALNALCMEDSRWFYSVMFACVWDTLLAFGYSRYGVETGALCVLHTWGQNLTLHPHIHCIVPAAGLTLRGRIKRLSGQGKYLYPVGMLSTVFRGKLLERIKGRLKEQKTLSSYQVLLDSLWEKPWVVFCEPPLGNAQQIVRYLGQYSHRVAISNRRILRVEEAGVTFLYKDYKDGARKKVLTLSGVEFLRRFCLHILPCRFVKIRYYGILSSKRKEALRSLRVKKSEAEASTSEETRIQRIVRITGFNPCACPFCKTGTMHKVELLPRIRAPSVLYALVDSSY